MPAGGKTRKRRKQNEHNREIKRTVRRGSVLCIIKYWDSISAIRGGITKQPQRIEKIKEKKRSISSLERHAPDLSPEILEPTAVFPVFSPELIIAIPRQFLN